MHKSAGTCCYKRMPDSLSLARRARNLLSFTANDKEAAGDVEVGEPLLLLLAIFGGIPVLDLSNETLTRIMAESLRSKGVGVDFNLICLSGTTRVMMR